MISVLYVDDDPTLLDLGKNYLECIGDFKVELQGSASGALELIGSMQFDAIISDYQMPTMDGLEFLRRVRQVCGEIPFILFTGRGREDVVILALNSGADFYLQKGGDPESQFAELAHAIRQAVHRRRADLALEESTTRLQNLGENIPGVIFQFERTADGKYRFPYISGRWNEIFDVDIRDAERIPEQIFARIDPEDLILINQSILHSATSREPWQMEFRARVRDKSMWIYGRSIPDAPRPDGTIQWNGVLIDITERKEAEEALKRSERDYRSIIENIQDAFYRTDARGDLLLVSPSFAHLFGYSAPDDVQGMNIRDTFYFTPPEHDQFLKKILTDGEIVEFRLTLKHKDGTPVIVSASSHVHYNENGKPDGVEGLLHDITDRIRMESVLAESECKYRKLLETLPYMVFEMDAALRITYANRAALDTMGYAQEDLEQRPDVRTLIDPSQHTRMLENLQVYNEGEPSTGREYRAVRKDGSTFPVMAYSVPLQENNRLTGYRGILIDISAMKTMEQDLQESKAKFESLVEPSHDGVIIVDLAGVLLYANKKMGEMIGFDPHKELVGTCPIFDFIQPEFREQARREFSLVAEDLDSYLTRYRIKTLKNTELWIECIGKNITYNGAKAVLVTIRDITSQKTLEGIIRENEEMYRNLADSLPDYVLVHREGKILYANRAILETLNLSYQEAVRSTVFDFVTPESRVWILDNIRRRSSGEVTGSYEVDVIVDRGEKRHGLVNSTLTTYKGEPAHLLVITDITERKQAELALNQVNAKLNTLSTITRHDLLNKLTALRGYLDLSKKAAQQNPALLAFLAKEQEIAAVMSEQINFTGFYQDIGVKKPRWIVLEKAIRSAARQLPLQQVALGISVDGWEVYADPLIEKVFYNLMENSLRHGEHVSMISLSAHEIPGGVAIEYCDDGVGIVAADKERIFERGFGRHSGLGMFLIREILSITGITIHENGIPARGVRFVITVPGGAYRYSKE